METERVRRFAYKFEPTAISAGLTKLLGLPNVRVSRPDIIAKAMAWHRQGLGFADVFHLTASQDQTRLLTLDAKLIHKAKGPSPTARLYLRESGASLSPTS